MLPIAQTTIHIISHSYDTLGTLLRCGHVPLFRATISDHQHYEMSILGQPHSVQYKAVCDLPSDNTGNSLVLKLCSFRNQLCRRHDNPILVSIQPFPRLKDDPRKSDRHIPHPRVPFRAFKRVSSKRFNSQWHTGYIFRVPNTSVDYQPSPAVFPSHFRKVVS